MLDEIVEVEGIHSDISATNANEMKSNLSLLLWSLLKLRVAPNIHLNYVIYSGA